MPPSGRGGSSRPDRRIAGDILGTLADITGITWTGRFATLYGFPPDETCQYLLEAGSFFISPPARHAFCHRPGPAPGRLRDFPG